MGGGNGGGDQVTETRPPSFQVPYIKRVLEEAERIYDGPPREFFPGRTVAPLTPAQREAQGRTVAAARGPLQEFANAQMDAGNFMVSPDILSPDTNPALQNYINTAIVDPVMRGLNEGVLPNVRSTSIGAGGTGSTRQGIAEGLAGGRALDAIARGGATVANTAYGQGLDAMGRALALGPQISQMQLDPARAIAAVGEQNRAFNQAGINEEIARHEFGQQERRSALEDLARLTSGNFGGQTTIEGQGGGSPLVPAVGTGLSAFALMASNPATAGAAPFVAPMMAALTAFA